jgi:hypothetical protein
VFDALTIFVGSDRVNAAAERLKGRESRRQNNLASLFATTEPRREGNGGGRHNMEETPPGNWGNRAHWVRGLPEKPLNVKRASGWVVTQFKVSRHQRVEVSFGDTTTSG